MRRKDYYKMSVSKPKGISSKDVIIISFRCYALFVRVALNLSFYLTEADNLFFAINITK
jgi:hypothetical protein